jgi:long-chain acyl-CoA synthetase
MNQDIKKDLYLRTIQLVDDKDKMTGIPNIDKPWLKYYSEESILSELPKMSAYEYLKFINRKNINRNALNYFGRKITFKELFENIDITANALLKYGIKNGDIVSLSLPNTPEAVYLFYALSKIGAIANMIDPRSSIKGIEDYLNEVNSNLLIIIDVALPKVVNVKNNTNVKNIISVSPADSLPAVMNLGFHAKSFFENFKNKNAKLPDISVKWKDFFNYGKQQIQIEKNYGCSEAPVLIVHTGGTTGTPKGVVLSNENINAMAYQSAQFPTDLKCTHRWLDIMPPFIAYGIGTGLHFPLALGMETILIPAFDPEKFDSLLLKYKPNHISGVPSHWNNIINSKKLKNTDLSFLITCAVGGDSMDKELEKKSNEFLKQHGCKYSIVKGYGMTEVNGSIGRTTNENNPIGSVGIPFAKSNVAICDPETGEELGYNKTGEVCMSGPSVMIGYYNNSEETNKIKKVHSDGKEWIHSGDLGYMTPEGNLFIIDRIKRIIVRHDGFKIFPSMIETTILSHPKVKMCKVVGMPDTSNVQGELPCAYIVVDDEITVDYKKLEEEIYLLCEKSLPEYCLPALIRYKDSLPLTPIGKVDTLKLANEIKQEINEKGVSKKIAK